MKSKKIFMALSLCTLGSVANAATYTNPAGTTVDVSTSGEINLNTGDTYINNGTITASAPNPSAYSYLIIGSEGAKIENNGIIRGIEKGITIYGTVGGERGTFRNTGYMEINDPDNKVSNVTVEISNSDGYNSSSGTIKSNMDAVRIGKGSRFTNDGLIESGRDGILAWDNDVVTNNGTINSGQTGIFLNTSGGAVYNNSAGIINSINYGIYSNDSREIINDGVITAKGEGIRGNFIINNGKIVVTGGLDNVVSAGVRMNHNYDTGEIGRFINSGSITSLEYAIDGDYFGSIMELRSGSKINGVIAGGVKETYMTVNGNVDLGDKGSKGIHKLIVSGDATISGRLDLDPSTNDLYYTGATETTAKNLSNIGNDTLIGNLTLKGTINVGVDYDGITDSTDKTGKIIASSITLAGGNITLTNAGSSSSSITEESGKDTAGDEIRIKSIVVSNKRQAVNPDFQFKLSDSLSGGSSWKTETVSRVENGVTVLDELYTRMDNPVPDSTPIPAPSDKTNAVPRNRVDLDNVNRMDSISGKFLDMESKSMNTGERRQTIEYIGTKGSKFNAENNYNYDYKTDADGISGTTLVKLTDNIYSGFTLGYTNNDVKYNNGDNEKVKSFDINIFGRYTTGKFDIDGHLGYGYNEHGLNADWLGAGRLESDYISHVLKGGVKASYNQELLKGISLKPSIGLDYVYVNEGSIRTPGMSTIDSATGNGVVGKAGLEIGNTEGKFLWNIGAGYEQNFTDTFHKERKMSNGYKMEKLEYSKGTFKAGAEAGYRITDNFIVRAGYEYEKNSNYENNNIKAGFSFLLGEKR